ncbi:hypothetical protein Tco_0518502, partial [Tanacetum coccineum]
IYDGGGDPTVVMDTGVPREELFLAMLKSVVAVVIVGGEDGSGDCEVMDFFGFAYNNNKKLIIIRSNC